MAWRDSRRSKPKLLLFAASISVGIAALVGINSFKQNLQDEIELQAKSLLGADLEVYHRQLLTQAQAELMDSLGGERSLQVRFASMIYFPRTDGTRLVQVRGLSGSYPYYGQIETEPVWAARDLSNGKYALVDEKLMLQYNVDVGDEIKVGNAIFEIRGKLKKIPGQSGVISSIAPVVYIPYLHVQSTGLIKKGSRITYSHFFKYQSEQELETVLERYELRFKDLALNWDTVGQRKQDTSESFQQMAVFLNLAAFIALLLGSIGVAGAVFIYLKEKNETVAILRCLGLKGRQAFYIYFYQVLVMGFVGSVAGAALGVSLQYFLPQLLNEILPVSIAAQFYWDVALAGVGLGMVVTVLFAILPLVSISAVSPLMSIRAAYDESAVELPKMQHFVIYFAITLFIFLFSYFQIGEWSQAAFFLAGLVFTFGLLFLISKGLMIAAKQLSARFSRFNIKQGIANLHRPNNQSAILILTIGLCTVLLSTLLFTRFVLIEQITMTEKGERPNMVLFDIQTQQKEELRAMTLDYDLPVVQDVPIVTMRLREINGFSKAKAEKDSTVDYPNWMYNREYRVTFRDSLINSETITEGFWQGDLKNESDSIFVSVSEGFAKNLKWEIGDEILFNVQGALILTYIGSFRKVDWRRVQTNFLVVFPTGVLESAPQFHVLVTKVDKTDVSARYQQAVVRNFPNVSIIDLELILKTVEEVLGQISFVINFMAAFSIFTGIIVLAGSVVLSKSQRIKESVLLRTLGASSRQIFSFTLIEYLVLGSIAALSGLILANGFSFLLAKFMFQSDFIFSAYYSGLIYFSITTGTVLLGLMNIRSVLNKPPLEILRKEI